MLDEFQADWYILQSDNCALSFSKVGITKKHLVSFY